MVNHIRNVDWNVCQHGTCPSRDCKARRYHAISEFVAHCIMMFHGGTALQAHWHIDSSRCCAQIVAQVTQHSVLEDRWTGSTRTAPRRFQRCARRARPKRALLATRTSLQTARRTQTRCAHRARSACFQAGRVSSSWSKIAPSSAIVCARVRPWGNASISRLAIPLAPDP